MTLLKKIGFTEDTFIANKYARITVLRQLLKDKLVDSIFNDTPLLDCIMKVKVD